MVPVERDERQRQVWLWELRKLEFTNGQTWACHMPVAVTIAQNGVQYVHFMQNVIGKLQNNFLIAVIPWRHTFYPIDLGQIIIYWTSVSPVQIFLLVIKSACMETWCANATTQAKKTSRYVTPLHYSAD